MVRERPAASCLADALGTKPSSAIAASTLARVAARTAAGRLSTLETVPSETPARAATSLMLTVAMGPPLAAETYRVRRGRPGSARAWLEPPRRRGPAPARCPGPSPPPDRLRRAAPSGRRSPGRGGG